MIAQIRRWYPYQKRRLGKKNISEIHNEIVTTEDITDVVYGNSLRQEINDNNINEL